MYMKWFNNIDSQNEQTNEVVQKQELNLWHQEILENYEYKDMFIDFINSLNIENKEKFLNIFKNLPDEELQEYLEDSFEDDSEENWEYFFDEFTEKYYIQENIETEQKLNPKVKEIITTINILTDADKKNQLIIDSLLKQIKELQSLNLKNQELELLKNNLITLNDYKEINETSKEINETSKGINEKAEKQKVEAEKQKVEAEKLHEWLNSIKSKIDIIKSINNDFWKKLDIEFNKKTNSKEEQTEKDIKIKEDIILFFKKEWNTKKFFNKLVKQNPKKYEEVYNALSKLSPEIKNIFDKEGIKSTISENLSGTEKWDKYKVYFLEDKDIIKEWNKVISWDKYIDFNENPPLWYITLKNWLKLKTKITAPHTMKLRAEFSKKQKEYEQKVLKLDENIKKLDLEVKDLKNDITEKKSRIEKIQNSDVSSEDKKRFINNIKEIIFKNQKLIELKIWIINENKSAIELENGKFKKVKDIFEKEMYEKIENSRWELLEWDEKVRKSLNFLDSIGIDSSLLSPLQSMIKQINRNSGLRNKLWFDRKINLNNNDLWIRNDWWERSDWENTSLVKAKFASIVNILLTWDKWHPININSLKVWNRTFENKEWETLDKDIAIWDIKRNMWINIYGNMFKNAMEYDSSKEK